MSTEVVELVRTLKENEVVIARGLLNFVETGRALFQIREHKQYRDAGHKTFEDYLQVRWGMNRARGYQFIEAAKVSDNLSTMVDKIEPPKTERVSRAVAAETKDPEEQREIWQEATAEKPEPTAADVKQAAERVRERKGPDKPKPAKAKADDQPGPCTELAANVEWVIKHVVPRTQEYAILAERMLGKKAGLFDVEAVKSACKTIFTEFGRIEREVRVRMEAEKRCSEK